MTWNLHAMRDLNRADPLGELGPRVERKPEPPPAEPDPVGIITDADGKMRTNLPLPGDLGVPVWPFPSKPIDDGCEGLPAEFLPVPGGGTTLYKLPPIKVGDRVRAISDYWSSDVRSREYVIDNLSEEWLTAGDVTGMRPIIIVYIDSEGDLWERA